jgi:hypothetical protein
MYELQSSQKTRSVMPSSPEALVFLSNSNRTIASRQSCVGSLRNVNAFGCRSRKADTPIHVKTSKDSGCADVIFIPARISSPGGGER